MFDLSPSHIAILLIIVILLFGATRLPKAAKSLGQSMHIFKKEVQGLSSDISDAANPPPSFSALPAPDPTQQQLSDLQRQLTELQQQTAANGQAGQPTQTQQPL
jgi:sec-independent protein translocase protein TatA